MEIYKTTREIDVMFKLLGGYHKQLGGEWKEFRKAGDLSRGRTRQGQQCVENVIRGIDAECIGLEELTSLDMMRWEVVFAQSCVNWTARKKLFPGNEGPRQATSIFKSSSWRHLGAVGSAAGSRVWSAALSGG